jgi:hypothetical protein
VKVVNEDNVGEPIEVLESLQVLGIDIDDAFDVSGSGWLDWDTFWFWEGRMDYADGLVTNLGHEITCNVSDRLGE